jgi:hypothetical protein
MYGSKVVVRINVCVYTPGVYAHNFLVCKLLSVRKCVRKVHTCKVCIRMGVFGSASLTLRLHGLYQFVSIMYVFNKLYKIRDV